MSLLLCADSPSIESMIRRGLLDILWHPSLSATPPGGLAALIARIEAGEQALDILCIEGSLITGPSAPACSTATAAGQDRHREGPRAPRPLTWWRWAAARPSAASRRAAQPHRLHRAAVRARAPRRPARGRLALRRRAAGDQPGRLPDPPDHHHPQPGPARRGPAPRARRLNRPRAFYGSTVHQGCTRNEYHEYDLEETQFGGRGCLFFNLGCQGPNTLANCNSELWNRRSSKPRAGVPCFSCTSPTSPGRRPVPHRKDRRGAGGCPSASPAPTTWPTRTSPAAAPKRVKNRTWRP